MKKYNRVNSNWMILGLVLPILIFFISMNIVYAYFTATATPAVSESKTGVIRIGFTETTTEKINSASIDASQLLVPGDNLEIDGAIENKGLSAVYSILKFDVEISKNNSTLKHITKYYTIKNVDLDAVTEEDNNLTEIAGNEDNYTATAFYLEAANEDKSNTYTTPFKLTYNFDGAIYGNNYQGANVNYTATAYAIQTVNLTDDASKEQMVATNLLMDNASYKNVTLLGNSYQPTSTGKNLYNFDWVTPNKTTVKNGVTFTKVEDGYLVNGTATDNAATSYMESKDLRDILEVGKTYTLSSIASKTGAYAIFYSREGKTSNYTATKTITGNEEFLCVYIQVSPNVTAENVYVKIQIEEGSTATAYEPYTGGLSGPSPTAPVEVQSLGNKTKNLLKISGRTEGTFGNGSNQEKRNFEFDKYYVGLTMNNHYYPYCINSYSIDGNSVTVEPVAGGYGVGFPVRVAPNTKYTASSNQTGLFGFGFYTSEGEFISHTQLETFTTPANCTILTFVFRPDSHTLITYNNAMLEQGSTATEYEPYGYKIEYTKTSKNLFDINGGNISLSYNPITVENNKIIIPYSAGNTMAAEFAQYVEVKSGKNYTISFNLIKGKARILFRLYDSNQTIINDSTCVISGSIYNQFYQGYYTDKNVQTYTFPSNVKYIRILICAMNYSADDVSIYENYQIEEGSTSTEYAPYHENSSGIIYLDQPLRKVGDVADYIDLVTGTVVRNIYKYNTSSIGTIYMCGSKWQREGYTSIYYLLDNRSLNGSNSLNNILSNNFSGAKWEWQNQTGGDLAAIRGDLGYILINNDIAGISASDDDTTKLSKAKEWLNNNDIYILYPLETSQTEFIDLPDIGDFNEGTIFTFNTTLQPSDIIIDA